jgi:hypothetical protein
LFCSATPYPFVHTPSDLCAIRTGIIGVTVIELVDVAIEHQTLSFCVPELEESIGHRMVFFYVRKLLWVVDGIIAFDDNIIEDFVS